MKRSVGYTQTENYVCLEGLENASDINVSNPLNLLYCGKEDCSPGWHFGPYVRENYVIHVITGGRGTFRTREREFRLSERDVFVIYPGEECEYEADRYDPWSYMWIGFNGLRARSIVDEMGFRRDKPVISLRETGKLSESIDKMLDAKELTSVNGMRRLAALYEALAIIIELSDEENHRPQNRESAYVSLAIELILASYTNKVRISDIADRVGINRSYLTNIFKKEMHISPQEFLINCRLEKAAQLLRTSNEPIGSIAASVGYADPLTFSKAFRKKFNSSPSEYRNTMPELATVDERGGYTGDCDL